MHELSSRRRHKPLRELPTLLREAVQLVWRAAPREATVIVSVNAATGILTAVQLGLTQRLLQAVLHVQDGRDVSTVIPELAAFVAVLTVLGILTLYQTEKKRVLSELVTQYSQVLVATAAADADLVEFERPSFHDRLQRTMANATTRPVDVTYALMGMVTSIFSVTGVIIALAIVQPILLALSHGSTTHDDTENLHGFTGLDPASDGPVSFGHVGHCEQPRARPRSDPCIRRTRHCCLY